METDEKVRENRLRRMAERQGFRLVKSRRRDPYALDHGGYMIVDPQSGCALAGDELGDYSYTLNDVEEWLTADLVTGRLSVDGEFVEFTVRYGGPAMAVPLGFDPRGMEPILPSLVGRSKRFAALLESPASRPAIHDYDEDHLRRLWRQKRDEVLG